MSERGQVLERDAVQEASPGYTLAAGAASAEHVPPGYKRTEVGVIPKQWRLIRLGDIAKVSSGGTPSRAVPKYWDGEIPWVTTSEVDFSVISQVEQSISSEGMKNSAASLLPSGTILMALYGQGKTRGKVGLLGVNATTNQACAAISLNTEADHQFVFQFLVSKYEAIRKLSNTGNQENLNSAIVRSIPVLVPSLSEQHAIATALSDADALIESLDRLIAKKRAIKQAAMQQLLTGHTRLPGFAGEWETKRLGELLTYERPDRYIVESTNYTEQGAVPVVTANKSFVLGYTTENFGICGAIPAIVFDDFTTDCKWIDRPFKVKSSAIKLLRAKNSAIDLRYAFERMRIIRFPIGDHKRYYISEYSNLELQVPGHEEQTAIATVLSDMDTEIEALEHRRDKARQIKQGMMQQLLTGRVRLVEAGAMV